MILISPCSDFKMWQSPLEIPWEFDILLGYHKVAEGVTSWAHNIVCFIQTQAMSQKAANGKYGTN